MGSGDVPINSADEDSPQAASGTPHWDLPLIGWHPHHGLTIECHVSYCTRSLISSNRCGPPLRGLWAHSRPDFGGEAVLAPFVWPNHPPLLYSPTAMPEPGQVFKQKSKMSAYFSLGTLSQGEEILFSKGMGREVTAFPLPSLLF